MTPVTPTFRRNINAVGKVILQDDASGWQTFSYGKLGELTENIRTFALPFENQTYTFKMQYEYDSWNRIQKMTYPDGEEVHYDYNLGGMLEKVYGQYKRSNMEPQIPIPHDSLIVRPMQMNTMGLNVSPGDIGPFPLYTIYTYPYIDSIAYNEFELKSEVFYGNGTHTQYDYDDIQRLQTLQSQTRTGAAMQSITYAYDSVSNIVGISNSANYHSPYLGGTYSHSYEYDGLYRLTYSTGTWEDHPNHLNLVDTVRMAYHKNGRIVRKNVFALTMSPTQMGVTNYNRRYDYSGQRNTLANVYDSVANTSQNFSWDNSGNMVAHNGRFLYWTEDNRLLTVTDNEWFSYYQYDAGGDRTYKLPYLKTYSNHSGRRSVYWAPEHSTLYASPYLVVTPRGYTKHYYAESERITSQIGRGKFSTLTTPVTDTTTANNKVRRADSLVLALNPSITDTAAQLSYLTTLTNRQKDTCEAYWYHTDHLGSSSWITDSAGNPVQHLHYLPWGEDFVDQRLNGYEGARYTFSAKEKDSETGLSYFGSRYYSSDLSVWLSVDPMSGKYPSLSPYTYCADNPVRLVDPDGEDPIYAKNFWGKVKKIGDDGQCGSGSYLVRGKTARTVKAATKAGEFYTGDLSASDEVIHIPTGQIQNDVQTTVQRSLDSGDSPDTRVEYGAHSLNGDKNALFWDPGRPTQTQRTPDGLTVKRRSVTPFRIDGVNYQYGGPPEEIEYIWHVHTFSSTPSSTDYSVMKGWCRVIKGTVFVVCPNDNKVSFYNQSKVLIRIKYEEFKRMGRQEDIP